MISHLDHLVLTVRSIDDTVHFYTSVLGIEKEVFGEGRVALKFAPSENQSAPTRQRILTQGTHANSLRYISTLPIEEAIVPRTLATQDENLMEVSQPTPHDGEFAADSQHVLCCINFESLINGFS